MTLQSGRMTPRERVSRSIRGLKPDKLPTVVINSNTFMCQYYGVSVEDYLSMPDICAEVNLSFIKEFEVDCNIIATGYILYGAGTELGVKWQFAGNNFPGHTEGPIKNRADLDNMKVPGAPSGYFKNYLDTINLVIKVLGDTHHLKASFLGPFSLTCFLRGIEQTLIDMLEDLSFFKECMRFSTELSVYLGRNLLETGLRYPILNEIFLGPGMMSPHHYHSFVSSNIYEVQRRLGVEVASNSFTFMGTSINIESQKVDAALYNAFFGVGESIETIKEAVVYRPPGFPFPSAISGRALKNWSPNRIISFLEEALNVLIKKEGLFPSISFSSVQAETKQIADDIANKIKAVNAFRNEYALDS